MSSIPISSFRAAIAPDFDPGASGPSGPAIHIRLRTERNALLGRIVAALDRDGRVRAVWLVGSFGRGTVDDWSDIDLRCVVQDRWFGQWLGELDGLFRRVGTPLLIGPERGLSGLGPGRSRSVLFTGLVSLDLDCVPESTAMRPNDSLYVFERMAQPIRRPEITGDAERVLQLEQALNFFWAMTPIALKYIARAWTARVVTQLDLLRNTVVQLWRLTRQPDRLGAGGGNWLNPTEDANIIRRLPRLGTVIDLNVTLDAVQRLMGEVVLLHPAIKRLGVTIPTGAVREVEALLEAVARLAVPLSPSSIWLNVNHDET